MKTISLFIIRMLHLHKSYCQNFLMFLCTLHPTAQLEPNGLPNKKYYFSQVDYAVPMTYKPATITYTILYIKCGFGLIQLTITCIFPSWCMVWLNVSHEIIHVHTQYSVSQITPKINCGVIYYKWIYIYFYYIAYMGHAYTKIGW